MSKKTVGFLGFRWATNLSSKAVFPVLTRVRSRWSLALAQRRPSGTDGLAPIQDPRMTIVGRGWVSSVSRKLVAKFSMGESASCCLAAS